MSDNSMNEFRKLLFMSIPSFMEWLESKSPVGYDDHLQTGCGYHRDPETDHDFYGASYSKYKRKTVAGAWVEEAQEIAEIAERITGKLPMMEAPSHRRTLARKGKRLNTAAFLSGRLDCWNNLERRERLGRSPVITIVLNPGASYSQDEQQIKLTSAATLALVQHLTLKEGRNVDLWAIKVSHEVWNPKDDQPNWDKAGTGIIIATRLKEANAYFNLDDMSALCNPAYLRRLCLAAIDRLPGKLKRINSKGPEPIEDFKRRLREKGYTWNNATQFAAARERARKNGIVPKIIDHVGAYGYGPHAANYNRLVREFFEHDSIPCDPLIQGMTLHGNEAITHENCVAWVEQQIEALKIMYEEE